METVECFDHYVETIRVKLNLPSVADRILTLLDLCIEEGEKGISLESLKDFTKFLVLSNLGTPMLALGDGNDGLSLLCARFEKVGDQFDLDCYFGGSGNVRYVLKSKPMFFGSTNYKRLSKIILKEIELRTKHLGDEMDDKTIKFYDETAEHIGWVRKNIEDVLQALEVRGSDHDASKLIEPELSSFAKSVGKLQEARYGTDEYQALLEELKPCIAKHYEDNDHHPEHYEEGIKDMSLLAILEMLCDWKAAGERTKDGSLRQSLDVNRERFKISDELFSIIETTATELGWL